MGVRTNVRMCASEVEIFRAYACACACACVCVRACVYVRVRVCWRVLGGCFWALAVGCCVLEPLEIDLLCVVPHARAARVPPVVVRVWPAFQVNRARSSRHPIRLLKALIERRPRWTRTRYPVRTVAPTLTVAPARPHTHTPTPTCTHAPPLAPHTLPRPQ
jgi:hypothetical protein